MIKKAFYSFIFISICYSLFISNFPNKGVGTHQWQENQIRAHRFLYDKTSDTVLVGTSLSARIFQDSISSVTFCAFSACVVEDGLRLILSKKVPPRYILIETNYLLRPSNGEIVKINTQGPMPFLRRYIPILREQNSPSSIMGYSIMQGALSPVGQVDLKRLEKNIEDRISDDYTHLLSEKQLEERIQTIMSLVRQLESLGVKIALYEMPLNKRLLNLPSNEQTRQIVHHLFPSEKYTYIPCDTSNYLTNDGEHLDEEGRRRYSHYFKIMLSSITIL